MRIPVSKDTLAIAGHTYISTLKTDFPIFNEELTTFLKTCLDLFSGLVGELISYSEGKTVSITDVKLKGTDKIEVTFLVNQNPAPIGAIVLAIIVVIGIFGSWLVIDSIDELVEDAPLVGAGIGGILIVGALLFGTKFLKG